MSDTDPLLAKALAKTTPEPEGSGTNPSIETFIPANRGR
jgi:hypothetical protein